MMLELKPEQQHLIDLALEHGGFQDPADVIDQAFEIIREQIESQEWMVTERVEIDKKIAEGFAQAERGELTDGETAVAMLRKRRAERRSPR